MISDMKLGWRPVTSGVLHGSILGPLLFNIFINDINDVADCTLCKFAGNTKLRSVVGSPGGCAALQMDLSRLEKWAYRNVMTGDPGGQEADHESVMNICGKGQQHPGLH